jgi:hypothetical protein
MVYADHLAPGAKLALPETPAVRVARESFENARELTLHIFDATEAAARERLAGPEPAASGAVHALQEFLNSVEDFKANPQRTLDDARAIIGAFPPSPVDIEPTVASSSAAVVAESSSASAAKLRSAPASEPGAEQFPLPSQALMATYDAFNNAATFLNNDVRAAMNHLLKTQLTPIATGLLPLFNAELLEHAKQHPEPVNLGV